MCCLFDLWSFHSFSLFFEYLSIFLCVRACTFFLPSRKTQWYHWAPTHKLSALHSQRRMLSSICPTQKITVRPPPLSLYYTWSADYLLSFCFTFLSPCCQLDSSSTVCIYTLTRVSHFLNGLVCCLFRRDKALLNRARWSHATKESHHLCFNDLMLCLFWLNLYLVSKPCNTVSCYLYPILFTG